MTRAYHFLRDDMTAGSGNEKPWEIGETRTIADPSKIALCEYGYHSSPSLWDALQYASGPIACLVEISQPLFTDNTVNQCKAVSATRKLIKAVNNNRELRLFACDCAEHVLPIYEREHPDDKRPHQAIDVSRRFVDGKATQEELAAAQGAARDAAQGAARDAARGAAWAAAAAARGAAWAAAQGAARDAAWAGARGAEVKWQRKHFEQMFGG